MIESTSTTNQLQENLDPDNWDDMRKLAHQMIDDTFDLLQNIEEEPVWRPMTAEAANHFTKAAPDAPQSPESVYDDFKNNVMPFHMGCIHPRFWSWYMGNGTIMGALGDYLTSMISSNAGGGNHVAQHLETQVLNWLKQKVDYPADASGILVSGGSMANYVGLAIARHEKSHNDIRKEGILSGQKQYVVYSSTEVHSCNQKAVELLGIGSNFLRKISTNEDFTINIDELIQTIQNDKEKGLIPICVIASAGTVNTGAIDDLTAIADICDQEELWFHVDGAIGGIAMIANLLRPKLVGIDRSDSLALDLHKWLHIPFEAGCVLIKNKSLHRDTFSLVPEYLAHNSRGLASGKIWYSEYGLQLSRRMRALKIWMSIKEHGFDRLGRMIDRNVEQAAYLGNLIENEPKLRLMAPIGMDIVCYQYHDSNLSQEAQNDINKNILVELQERGLAAPSYTTLHGQYCIRVAIANHRSTLSDFDFLVQKTIEIGNELRR